VMNSRCNSKRVFPVGPFDNSLFFRELLFLNFHKSTVIIIAIVNLQLLGPMAHACNPSSSRGRDKEDHSLRSTWEKS
jgi:hypothetical protein